jgi:hypothetical protein
LIEGRELVIPEYEDEEENPLDDRDGWLNGVPIPEHSDDDKKNTGDFSEADDEQSDITPESCIDQLLTTGHTGPGDLKSLRARAWTLAARLAQRNGIGDLVAPLSKQGLGFVLCDVPDPALADQLDHDSLSQVSMVWWQLAACAEMTVAPVETILANLSSDSVLRQALEQQDAALLFNSVWTLDPGHTGYSLWRRLVDQDWHDLLNLMDTYRRIHHLAQHTQTALWELA